MQIQDIFYSDHYNLVFFFLQKCLNLPDGSNISVERRTLSYNDQSKKYLEFAWFDRATGDVTADVCTQDMFGSKRVETNSPPKIVEHKDLFLKAPGLSKPARTL